MTRAWRPVAAIPAVALCLLPVVVAHAQQETDYYIAGVQKIQQGEYDAAVSDLLRAVAQAPESGVAWYYLGVAQFETVFQSLGGLAANAAKDYSEADKSLAKAMTLTPSAPGPRYYRGRIAEETGALEAAKAFYREELSLRRLPDPNKLRVALARVAYKSAKYQNCLDLLKEALDAEPKYIEALYYRGLCQTALKDYTAAVKTFEGANKVLNEWLDAIYRLLRVEYLETAPDKPEKASRVVENWDELRKELWNLRQASARPNKQTLEVITQQFIRCQQFALELHMWPSLNKALGDAHLGNRDWSAARNAYRHAMKPREGEGSEEDVDAWARIGRAYFLNGKATFEEKGLLLRAIDELKAAEGDQDPDPSKWDGFGRALHVAGVDKRARLAQLRQPPEPDPVLASALDGLGELYLYQAETYQSNPARGIVSHTQEDALGVLNKALVFCPDYVPALMHKAKALMSRADRVTASGEDLAETMGGAPPEEDWQAYLTPEEHYQAAAQILRAQAIPKSPKNPDLWAQLSRAYVALDKLDDAAKAAAEALKLDQKHVVALNMDGLVKYYRHECVAAANAFALAVQAAPKDFQSYLNLGNALYGLQSWELAQREYIRALELIPQVSVANTGSQRPYVLYLIARTQNEQKLYEQAVQTLNEALKLRTDFYDAQRLLAAAYSGLQQWTAAEEALRGCLKSAPNDRELAASHAHLGMVYEVQGLCAEAIAEYRMALAKYPGNLDAKDGLQRLAYFDKQPAAGG